MKYLKNGNLYARHYLILFYPDCLKNSWLYDLADFDGDFSYAISPLYPADEAHHLPYHYAYFISDKYILANDFVKLAGETFTGAIIFTGVQPQKAFDRLLHAADYKIFKYDIDDLICSKNFDAGMQLNKAYHYCKKKGDNYNG